ncbi:MAG: hypothetical protein JWN78_2857 [Bacteroidota bacterium]|nr:hypothetical protein [Bacteroidota bacterium]
MTNKILIRIILILSILTLTALLYDTIKYNETINFISILSLDILIVIGLYLLFINSTIRKTIYWRIICVCIAMLLIGLWMKILHLSIADTLIIFALSTIGIVYLIRFIKKDKKTHLDYLKIVWILSSCLIADLTLLHILTKEYGIISRTLFGVTLVDFCLIEFKLIEVK